jgi:hypothetical protein
MLESLQANIPASLLIPILGGDGMVIHTDENRLTRNIFPFSINVKEVCTLLVPNTVFNRHVALLDQRGTSAAPEEWWPPPGLGVPEGLACNNRTLEKVPGVRNNSVRGGGNHGVEMQDCTKGEGIGLPAI